jgi:uncharacterized protein (TIGR03437 family)
LKLAPAVITVQPTITPGGVVSASAFDARAGAAPGTWMEIYGSNLASTTRSWEGSDFQGNNAPTSLDQVSVTIGGKNAYIDYVSPQQVNIQVPDDIPIGSGVPLILKNPLGETVPYMLQTADSAPALLAPSSFNVNGKQYVVAALPADDPSGAGFVGPIGGIPGIHTRPAKEGDIVTLYGIGFGPVTPSDGSGVIVSQPNSLTNPAIFLIGQTEAKILYGGLAPGFIGLYQFNLEVPALGAGDLPFTVQTGGRSGAQDLSFTAANQ